MYSLLDHIPKIMALDYGRERVGVALSYATLAEPHRVLANNDQLIPELQKLVTEYKIEQVIVGISQREMAAESQVFGEKIRQDLSLPVEFVDENYSSKHAHTKLYEQRIGKQKYTGAIDHFAAAIFLQRYLDEEYA